MQKQNQTDRLSNAAGDLKQRKIVERLFFFFEFSGNNDKNQP